MTNSEHANWQELSHLWNRQNAPAFPEADLDTILDSVRRHHRAFRRAVFRRDLREFLVGLLLTAFFAYVAVTESGYARAGALVLVLSCLGVTGAFVWTRHRARSLMPDKAANLRGELEASLAEVEYQIRLLSNVRWWYLMPLAVGMTAWLTGSVIESPTLPSIIGLFIIMPVIALVFIWVERLNRKAVREDLRPRAGDLRDLLDQFNGPGQSSH